MKLLHITATHLNLAGGIPVVLRDLVEAQNKIDEFEARVLSIKADPVDMNSVYFDRLDKKSFRQYIKEYLPDVVVFHSHYYFEYNRLYRILLKCGIPYYIEPHGSFGKAALNKSKYKKIVANRLLLRRFMNKAKGFIFLNESEKKDSQFSTNNDLIIPNGITAIDCKAADNKPASWFFYFIGRFDIVHKGLDFLMDALDILDKDGQDIHFRLFGTGNKEEVRYLDNRIKQYKNVCVENCGPIYGNEQSRMLQQSGIMVLTSRYEGFPMTVLEAWNYGNPVLVTPGTNVSELVSDNGLGWVADLDAKSISNCLKIASKDYSNDAEKYYLKCNAYVKMNYGWDAIARLSKRLFTSSINV